MVDNATAGLNVAAQKYGTSQLNVDPDAFNKAMTNFYETGKMTYEQREILSQGFSLLQEPLIDAGKNLGALDSITSRLSKNFDKASTSTAALTKETLEAKNKTGKEGRTFT
jgi:folylpolyglutamate synthase/dihydropteroate synthase